MKVRTGVSQAASSSRGSCRSTSPPTATCTRPAPAASARPSAPPRGSYRTQCAGPDARVLPPAAKECLTPGNPAVPPPPAPHSGVIAPSAARPRTCPGRAPGARSGRRLRGRCPSPWTHPCPHPGAGAERPNSARHTRPSLQPLPRPPQAHPTVRTTLRGHQGKREHQSCTGQELGQSAARVGRQVLDHPRFLRQWHCLHSTSRSHTPSPVPAPAHTLSALSLLQ